MRIAPLEPPHAALSLHSTKQRTHWWWLAAILLVVMPFMLHEGLLRRQGMTFTDLAPLWSDEVYYWHQAATFARVGFDGGYYSVDEKPAPIGRFYSWGLAVPVFYGSIGRVMGWPLWAVAAVNMVLLSAVLMAWIAFTRPTIRQMMALLIWIATFAPFLLFRLKGMIEVMNMAWALVISGAIYALYIRRETVGAWRWGIAAFALVFIAAQFRLTWGILLPFVGALALARSGWRGVLVGSALGVGAALLSFVILNRTSAPYPGNFTSSDLGAAGLGSLLSNVFTSLKYNIESFFYGYDYEVWLRAQMVLLLGILSLQIVTRWRQKPASAAAYERWEIAFFASALLGILFVVHAFYLVGYWNGYRHFAPFCLLCGAFLISRQRWGLVGLLIVSSLVFLPSALNVSHQWTEEYRALRANLTALQEQLDPISPMLVYDDDAPSPWCNTVSHNSEFFFPPAPALLVEPGLGLTAIFVSPSGTLLKARYVMLTDEWLETSPQPDLEALREMPEGTLYLNRAAPCDE